MSPAANRPLLFVHGAMHGAWCWDEHFVEFFTRRGYHAVALDLRGRPSHPVDIPVNRIGVADFLSDIDDAVRALPRSPILVGHSLGGYLVQRYAELNGVPGIALLASSPPTGTRLLPLVALRRHPVLALRAQLTRTLLPLFGSPTLAREWFFTDGLSDAEVSRYARQLQEDSVRAGTQAVLRPVRTHRVRCPVLVVGGAEDNLLRRREVLSTATRYGVTAHFVDDVGHDLMLDVGWCAAADVLERWLASAEQMAPTPPHEKGTR